MWSELPRRARGGGGATTTGGSHCVVPDPVLWKYVSPLVWGLWVGTTRESIGWFWYGEVRPSEMRSHCVVPDRVLWKYVSPLAWGLRFEVWGLGFGVWGSQLGFGGLRLWG